jgi:hypothetical protein
MSTVTALPTGTTATVLDRAADYLIRYGWVPSGLYDPHVGCTARCACHRTGTYPASIIGAIRYAVHGAPRWYFASLDGQALHDYTAAVEWLNTYLIAIGHAGLHAPIFAWQTTPGRTVFDVTDALHHAAGAYRHHHTRRTAA